MKSSKFYFTLFKKSFQMKSSKLQKYFDPYKGLEFQVLKTPFNRFLRGFSPR